MEIRSFSPEQDFKALLRLRSVIESHDQDDVDTSEIALLEQIHWHGHNPTLDRWVIDHPEKPGELIAHALIWVNPDDPKCHATANIAVHPLWRNKGLGSALLASIIQRSRSLTATYISIQTNALRPTGSGFLRNKGFTAAGLYTLMHASMDLRLPPVIWPVGYTMLPFSQVNDLEILVKAMNECYFGLWGHHKVNQEQMLEWMPSFTPEALFLVFSERGKAIGISRVEVSEKFSNRYGQVTGYIDAPGILTRHRRLDLYRALLLTGFYWLKGKNVSQVILESWGDNPAVLDMYIELGFQYRRQVMEYRLILNK